MPKKPFKKTAFFKNAKRIIQENKPGAYVLTGYTGSGKTELLKELILVFEDVYHQNTDDLEMYLFDGKGSAFKMFDNSRFVIKRSATLEDLANSEELLHPLTSSLKVPLHITSGATRKLIVIDECSAFQELVPSDVKYLYWLINKAKELGLTVIIADQNETLDIFNSSKIRKLLRMVSFETLKTSASHRLIDVPNVDNEEMMAIQKDFQEELN